MSPRDECADRCEDNRIGDAIQAIPHNGVMRIFDRYRFGNLVAFWVLDGRQ